MSPLSLLAKSILKSFPCPYLCRIWDTLPSLSISQSTKRCVMLLWILVKLRKGTGLNSPGKIQVQQDRIVQGSPSQLQNQPEHLLLPSRCCLSSHKAKSLTTDSRSLPSVLLPARPRVLFLAKPRGQTREMALPPSLNPTASSVTPFLMTPPTLGYTCLFLYLLPFSGCHC